MFRTNLLLKVLCVVLFASAVYIGNLPVKVSYATECLPCEGNFDCDSDIDGSDLAIFAADFGRTDCCGCQIGVPKTGQTTCYDVAGNVIDCTNTGQDGDLQMGIPWPVPRFTDNGDGTVTDNLTGLIWLKDANCANTIGHDPDGTGNGSMTWQHALDFVAGINDGTYLNCGAGYDDWRLSNVRELQSLIDYGRYGPALPVSRPFDNVQSFYYWSSTSHVVPADYAWCVFMINGSVYFYDKDLTSYVWPVRAGQ